MKKELALKTETQILEDHQAKLTVEVEPELLDEMKHKAVGKIARKIKIPGFRPGKAPYPVVIRQVGEAAVLEEAMELLVDDIYPKVIEASGIQPYGPGRLDKVASMEPLTLEFIVPLDAEVTLGDYRSIRIPYEPSEVNDEDVENVVENLRERQAIIEPVERAAQEGDLVTIKITGRRKNPAEGQDEILTAERTQPVIVRSESEKADEAEDEEVEADEWPFNGFSRHLIGVSAGETHVVEYTYPEESGPTAYRGVEAEFDVVVENVKSRQLPEVNDEFAATQGDFENLEALRANIRAALEDQARNSYNENYDDQVLEKLVEGATFKYPPQMLDHETEHVIEDMERRLERQKLDMDLYLKARNLDMDGLRAEARPVAETRMKRSLAIFELGRTENIQVEPEELQNEAVGAMNYLYQTLSEKESRRLNDQSVRDNLVNSVLMELLQRKTQERLRDIASGKQEQVEAEQKLAEAEKAATEAASEESALVKITEVETSEVEAVEVVETVSDESISASDAEISTQDAEQA
jgi:trigger factor